MSVVTFPEGPTATILPKLVPTIPEDATPPRLLIVLKGIASFPIEMVASEVAAHRANVKAPASETLASATIAVPPIPEYTMSRPWADSFNRTPVLVLRGIRRTYGFRISWSAVCARLTPHPLDGLSPSRDWQVLGRDLRDLQTAIQLSNLQAYSRQPRCELLLAYCLLVS